MVIGHFGEGALVEHGGKGAGGLGPDGFEGTGRAGGIGVRAGADEFTLEKPDDLAD